MKVHIPCHRKVTMTAGQSETITLRVEPFAVEKAAILLFVEKPSRFGIYADHDGVRVPLSEKSLWHSSGMLVIGNYLFRITGVGKDGVYFEIPDGVELPPVLPEGVRRIKDDDPTVKRRRPQTLTTA